VTKSVTSALVGIAVEEGLVDIEVPVGYAEWAGTESEAIVLRNLISNDSGREWSFNADYVQMGLAMNQTQFAIDLGQAEPIGTFWEYNNAAIQTVERALSTAVGSDVGAYAEAKLFSQIHMTATMGHDGAGNSLTYQGVSASCRDLARFGYLYLRQGRWAGGVQVVPEAWVAESVTPSTDLNSAYGFMWWLNRDGHWVQPSAPLRVEGDGKLIASAPEEVFAAIGAFGQYVVVDPTSETVWVRLGPLDLADSVGFAKLPKLWDAFAAAQLP
jgi:CubicO group peptidase (beta-lactamase class C family)